MCSHTTHSYIELLYIGTCIYITSYIEVSVVVLCVLTHYTQLYRATVYRYMYYILLARSQCGGLVCAHTLHTAI